MRSAYSLAFGIPSRSRPSVTSFLSSSPSRFLSIAWKIFYIVFFSCSVSIFAVTNDKAACWSFILPLKSLRLFDMYWFKLFYDPGFDCDATVASIFLNHLCCKALKELILCVESKQRHYCMKSSPSGEIIYQMAPVKSAFPSDTDRKIWALVSPSKGGLPERRMYMSTPALHTSHFSS